MAEGLYRLERFLGLNQAEDEWTIPEGASPDLQNVVCEGGMLRTVKGCVRYASGTVPGGVRSLAALLSRERPRLIAGNEGAIYCLEEDGGWRLLYEREGLGRLACLNYAKDGRDVVLLATGGEMLWWDGEGAMEPIAGAPEGMRHLALHYERVWAAGRREEPDAVYWSRAYDPEDWSPDAATPEAGGGFVLVPTWNGGRVRGLRNHFGDVVVFKDQDIFRIYGTYPGNYEVVRVHGVSGPVAERTVVPWDDRVFFLSREGLCAYDGVTAKPVNRGRARRFFEGVDFDAAQETACAALVGDRLYLAVPEKGYGHNNAILEIDLGRDVWTVRRGVRADDFLVWEGRLLFGNEGGGVYALGEGDSYDGERIQAYWEGKPLNLGRKGARMWGGELRACGEGEAVFRQRTERGESVALVRLGGRRPGRARLRASGGVSRLRIENREGRPFRIDDGIEWEVEVE